MRILDFSDGFSSSSAPSLGAVGTTNLLIFVNDAAFVTSKGSVAISGDFYFNSTDHFIHVYDGTTWQIAAMVSAVQTLIFGSRGSPRTIVAATGITVAASHMSATILSQDVYVQGNGAPTTISAATAIQAGTIDGQRLAVVCRHATNTLTIPENGTNGVSMNGPWTGGIDDVIRFRWDTSNWSEEFRSN